MRLVVLSAILAVLAAGQDTGTVEGVVVNKATGAGIANASVRFMAPRSDHYETITDENGVFQITLVKPGDYSALVEKSGYFSVDTELFPPFPGGRPKYHVIGGGESLRLRLELNPPAVLKGRVIGPDGKPMRSSLDLGKGRTVNTDAEGSFTFENLSPGPYTLLARPKTTEPTTAHEGTRTEVVPTYYPSAVDPAQAQRIVVGAGAELTGYEIRLQSVPVYRVRGVVLSPDGKPAVKAVVELQPHIPGGNPGIFLGGTSSRQVFSIRTGEIGLPETEDPFVTRDDGVFEFPTVPAGDWTLRAEGDPAGSEGVSSVGSAMFSLGHGDPDDLKIQLAAPFHLSGSAVLTDGSPPPKGVMLAISLYSETGRSGSGGITEPSGTLRLDVMPGAHEIRADVMFGNYYVDSILLGSTDVTAQRVELAPASPPVKIILKPASTIRGTIEDAEGGTVVLFPQSITGIAYSASSGAGKTFALDGIPPGDYYAIALDRFDPRTMADAIRLRSLIPLATSVKVQQSSASPVQLKVHHLAD